jgi:hypothetical protein
VDNYSCDYGLGSLSHNKQYNNNMKNKKAEISVGMIIGLVVVVMTFGILALVYSNIMWSTDFDREVCSISAKTRGTITERLALDAVKAKDIIPIKCKTKLICVTTNTWPKKGECGDVFGTLEGKFVTYRIKDKDAENQIKTLMAREMADCWDMLGRGHLAIFNREFTTEKSIGAVAIICSRIHFDKTITEGLGIKEISEMNRYLLTHKVPNHEVSYWDFLRNSYHGETMAILSGPSIKGTGMEFDFYTTKTPIDKTKAIIFLEARPTLAGAIVGGLGGGLVGTIGGGLIGGPKVAIFGGSALTIAGAIIGDEVQKWFNTNQGMFPDGTTASGIFLTDYTLEGFREIKDKEEKMSFEIASYA